jgi:hypothetical protein
MERGASVPGPNMWLWQHSWQEKKHQRDHMITARAMVWTSLTVGYYECGVYITSV